MKYILKILTISFSLGSVAMAQTKLSLKEAVDYAIQNHPDIQNKVLGEKYADAQVMEKSSRL